MRPLNNYWKALLLPIHAGAALLFIPIPEGLSRNAWYYFALFVAVVIPLILEPIPVASVGLIGVTAATVSLLVMPKPADAIRWALSGFRTARRGSPSLRLCLCWATRKPDLVAASP